MSNKKLAGLLRDYAEIEDHEGAAEVADNLRLAAARLEGEEVVGRGWIRKVEENGECRSWLVDEVGWEEAPEHLQVVLVRRREGEDHVD